MYVCITFISDSTIQNNIVIWLGSMYNLLYVNCAVQHKAVKLTLTALHRGIFLSVLFASLRQNV